MTDAAIASSSTTYRLDGDVAVVEIDDGKANALSPAVLGALDDALSRAEDEARAMVLLGRPGRFSAGFDLSVMTAGTDQVRALVGQGGRFMMRLCTSSLPIVAGCTGHALAAGAIALLACDHRVGADAPAKIGLNEVAIGMPLPIYAVELARHRLAPRALTAATLGARIYDPEGAQGVGYLDRVVAADSLVEETLADAHRFAELRPSAYRGVKRLLRGPMLDHVLATLDADIATITGPTETQRVSR